MAGDKAGMKVGDCIQEVDGLPVKEAQSVQIIRGPVGSKVTLKVVRGLKQALVEVEKDKQIQERRRKQMESLKDDATETSRFEEIEDSTADVDQVTDHDDSNANQNPEMLEIVLTRESGKKKNIPISKPRFDGPEQEAKKDQ